MKTLHIFTHPKAGICNRLKHIITSLKNNNGLFEKVRLSYPPGYWINTPFLELFSIEGIDIESNEEDMATKNEWSFGDIDYRYNDIDDEIKKQYLYWFNRIKPSSKVKSLMGKFNFPEDYISVHIRHDKNWKDHNRWGKNDIERFRSAMLSYPKSTKFFISSMNVDIMNWLYIVFPNRIFTTLTYLKNNNYFDVADLYFLSKGQEMILTNNSTFSEVGWWLGGANKKVTVI